MKTLNKVLLVCLSIIAFSCEDILETDITNDTVQIISPLNNAEINSNVVNFQWNSMKGASDYRVQVYGANQTIVLDSLVSKTNFTSPLDPGTYQWRVRGENSAYTSNYSFPVNFKVIENDDLSDQQVVLLSPANNLYTKNTTLNCTWTAINVASSYTFELENVNSGIVEVTQSGITTPSFNLTNSMISSEAEYLWRVKAVNATNSTSTLFSSRTFFVDRVKPNQPVNTFPTPTPVQIINQPIAFTWTMSQDTGTIQSAISYEITFSTSADFTTNVQSQTSTTTSITKTFATVGIYYWKVKAIDAAGNESISSTATLFTIQ